ncbi:MAG: NUDIX hydrolase [Candidatus Parcubacteria bacterium]|nr:NUDIX hydrolase [Candidatus Parcubacteria bacterium]
MVEYKHLPSINEKGEANFTTIVAGPVIFQDGKVLLDKHGDDEMWKFPGGAVEDDNGFESNAKRRVKEELGVEVELISEPFILTFKREREGKDEFVVLIHFLAKIVGGGPQIGLEVAEFAWHDINNLPADCAPNIKPVVEYFTKN